MNARHDKIANSIIWCRWERASCKCLKDPNEGQQMLLLHKNWHVWWSHWIILSLMLRTSWVTRSPARRTCFTIAQLLIMIEKKCSDAYTNSFDLQLLIIHSLLRSQFTTTLAGAFRQALLIEYSHTLYRYTDQGATASSKVCFFLWRVLLQECQCWTSYTIHDFHV